MDVVEFGPPRPPGGWRRWVLVAATVLVAVPVVTAVVRAGTPSTPASTATPTRTGERAAVRSSPGEPPPSRVTVTDTDRRLLGATTPWELFGRGPRGVVRIEPALGRLTRTSVPALQSSGPVSFVVTGDRAVVRPLDFVPGYVVRDGQPARTSEGALGRSGPALPGPDPRHLWVQAGSGAGAELLLVDLAGRATGTSVEVPAGAQVSSDGHGYPMFTTPGGVYQGRPSGPRRITTGSVTAAGPTGWLAVECDDRHRCERVLVSRADGKRRVVPGHASDTDAPLGVVAPDGSTAAVYHPASGAEVQLRLLDLRTGADRVVHVEPARHAQAAVAWSPDGRWLTVATSDQDLVAVDARTGRVRDLGVALPQVDQVAVRAPHGSL